MAGPVPAIHVFEDLQRLKAWMPGTGPGMTGNSAVPNSDQNQRSLTTMVSPGRTGVVSGTSALNCWPGTLRVSFTVFL